MIILVTVNLRDSQFVIIAYVYYADFLSKNVFKLYMYNIILVINIIICNLYVH